MSSALYARHSLPIIDSLKISICQAKYSGRFPEKLQQCRQSNTNTDLIKIEKQIFIQHVPGKSPCSAGNCSIL